MDKLCDDVWGYFSNCAQWSVIKDRDQDLDQDQDQYQDQKLCSMIWEWYEVDIIVFPIIIHQNHIQEKKVWELLLVAILHMYIALFFNDGAWSY